MSLRLRSSLLSLGLAASAALALSLAAGCQQRESGPRWGAAGATSPHRGGKLRFSTTDAARTLDPAIAYDEVSLYASQHLFDTLVGYPPVSPERPRKAGYPSPGVSLLPQLAESWTLSDDGLTLRFALRPGIRYADGVAIVAADFKYALERVLKTGDSPFAGFLSNVEGATALREGKATDCRGLRAPDDRHLEIALVKRDTAFLYVLAMKFATPLRKDYVETPGRQVRREPLASGPYMLTSWQEGQRMVFARNPHHWDAQRGWLDEITMLENVPRDIELLMFERGDVDTCYQPAAPDYLWLLEQPRWRPYIRRVELMNVFGERMNVTRPPFNDVRVRRALNYALNKDHTTRLLLGTAVPAHGILPPGMPGRDESLRPYPHDPARARQLLAEAGYPDGIDLEYATLAGDEPRKLAASLQADLAEAGIRLKIVVLSAPTYLATVGSKDGPAMSYTSWTQDYPDPASFIDARFHSRMIADEGAVNDNFFSDPTVDALIDEARVETDAAKRAAIYRRLERILYDAAPWVWGYHRVAIEVVQPYVKDYEPHPVGLRDFTSTWLDLDAQGRRVPWSPTTAGATP